MSFYQLIFTSITLLLSMVSGTSLANTSCNIDLSAGMKIDTNTLEFFQEVDDKTAIQKSLYRITNGAKGQNLVVDGQLFSLSEDQQRLIREYDKSIRQIVPEIKTVAMESVDLAIEGIDLSFNDLLGADNQLSANLIKELKSVKAQLADNLSIEKGVSIGVTGTENQGIFAKDIEQRVEQAIEKAVLNSMGAIFIAIGQQVIFADENAPSFDTRMKNFKDKVEQEIDIKTEKIYEKSQVLCKNISRIDSLEEQLKNTIKPLSTINVFTVTVEHEK